MQCEEMADTSIVDGWRDKEAIAGLAACLLQLAEVARHWFALHFVLLLPTGHRVFYANHIVTMIANDPRIRRTVSTMSMKLTGKADLLLREAIAIKQILGTNTPIEILFQTKTTE